MQCEDVVTPEAVLPLDEDQMRGVGLSYAKVKSCTQTCGFVQHHDSRHGERASTAVQSVT